MIVLLLQHKSCVFISFLEVLYCSMDGWMDGWMYLSISDVSSYMSQLTFDYTMYAERL